MNKKLIFLFFLILLILISGCKGKKDVKKALEEIRTGTEGVIVSFMPNNPPATVHAEESADNGFKVVLEIRNKGAFPQPEEGAGTTEDFGKIYLSGYDKNIITIIPESFGLSKSTLEGKSPINPNGGIDFASFDGNINFANLNVDKYESALLATACYQYFTVAGPSVCIDPDPYSTISERKVCQVQDITLTNQGAPIAITKIDEEALASKTQFRITIKNVGNGDVLKDDSSEKCNPHSTDKLSREDIDKVFVHEVKVSDKPLQCGPFAEGNVKSPQGFIRLINGEGSIICELPKSEYGSSRAAYKTPLTIRLNYFYRSSVERKLLVKRESSGIGVEVSSTIPVVPSSGETDICIKRNPDGTCKTFQD